jgi:hypothetical protein
MMVVRAQGRHKGQHAVEVFVSAIDVAAARLENALRVMLVEIKLLTSLIRKTLHSENYEWATFRMMPMDGG